MSQFKHSFILSLLLSMSQTLYAFEQCQIPPMEERELKPYTCSVKLKNGEDLEFTIQALSRDGKRQTTLQLKKNEKTHLIKLQNYREEIGQLFVDRRDDLLFLFYELGDVEAVGSYAAAFSIRDFKQRWKTRLAGFNLTVVRNGDFAIASAVGFVAKIDLLSGKIQWRHVDLYEKQKFVGGKPTIEKGVINFSNTYGKDVRIDEKTGKILN